jgi:alpha-beta hydrolase superfamily lysophospholipase
LKKENIIMNGKLSYQIFRTQEAPHACVFIVHGMQEHQKRYDGFAKYLNSRGIACITYDLPGHGSNCPKEDLGWFGDQNGWMNLTDSAVEIANLAHQEFPHTPIVLFGHSMGTMIGRTFLQDHDSMIDAMILSGAPNYQPASKAGIALASIIAACKGKKGHSHMLDNLATGSFNKAIADPRTPLDWLSCNQDNVDAYIADPLCGFPFTNQGYKDLFLGMGYMHDPARFHCTKPNLPILFFAGEDDPCRGGDTGFKDSIASIRNAGYKNVSSTLYPGMRHETLHEKDADHVMKDTADWILKNI